MRTKRLALLLPVFALCLAAQIGVSQEAGDALSLPPVNELVNGPYERVWTNADGKKAAATLMRIDSEHVVLRRFGADFKVAKAALSQKDRDFAAQQAKTLADNLKKAEGRGPGPFLEATQALMRLGPLARPAIPLMIQKLTFQEEEIRMNAAAVLGGCGAAAAAAEGPLLKAAATDIEESVRLAALLALAQIKGDPQIVVPAATEACRSGKSSVDKVGATALKRMPPAGEAAAAALSYLALAADPGSDQRTPSEALRPYLYPADFSPPPPVDSPIKVVEGNAFAARDEDIAAEKQLAKVKRPAASKEWQAALDALIEVRDGHPRLRRGSQPALNLILRRLAATRLAAAKDNEGRLAGANTYRRALANGELTEDECFDMAQAFIAAGDPDKALEALLAYNVFHEVKAVGLRQLYLHLAQRDNVASRWKSEEEFIIIEVAEELVRQLHYLGSGSVPTRAHTVGISYEYPAWDQPSVRILTVSGAGLARPLTVKPLALKEFIWSPESFLPLARKVAAALKVDAAGKSAASDAATLPFIEALADLRGKTIQQQNAKLSRLLQRDFGNAAHHEAAALLLASLALREQRQTFADIRSHLNRMSVHLTMARLLRGGQPLSAGRLAEAALNVLAGRTKAAMGVLDGMPKSNPEPVRRWSRALRLRCNRDWRKLPQPEKQSLLERLMYYYALLATRRPNDEPSAVEFAKRMPDAELLDWKWPITWSLISADRGRGFPRNISTAALQEQQAVLGFADDTSLDELAEMLDGEPGSCVGSKAGRPAVQVIDRGTWRAFYRRHVMLLLYHQYRATAWRSGQPAAARRAAADAAGRYRGLSWFPVVRYRMDSNSVSAPKSAPSVAQLMRVRPEEIGYDVFSQLRSQVGGFKPRDENRKVLTEVQEELRGLDVRVPHFRLWFAGRPPFGTAYQLDRRQYMVKRLGVYDAGAMAALDPWSLSLYLRTEPAAAPAESRELSAYSPGARQHAMNAVKDKPKAYVKLMREFCEEDPTQYRLLVLYLKKHKLFDEAIEAFLQAMAKSPDRGRVVGLADWACQFLYNRNRPGDLETAVRIAEYARDVGSLSGHYLYVNFMNQLGRFREAERSAVTQWAKYAPAKCATHGIRHSPGNDPRLVKPKEFHEKVYHKYGSSEILGKYRQTMLAHGDKKNKPRKTLKQPAAGRPFRKGGLAVASAAIVVRETAASKAAGLQLGDIITSANGFAVHGVLDYIYWTNADIPVKLVAARRGLAVHLTIPENAGALWDCLAYHQQGDIWGAAPKVWQRFEMKRVAATTDNISRGRGRLAARFILVSGDDLVVRWDLPHIERAVIGSVGIAGGAAKVLGEFDGRSNGWPMVKVGDRIFFTGKSWDKEALWECYQGKMAPRPYGEAFGFPSIMAMAALNGKLYLGHGSSSTGGSNPTPGRVIEFDGETGVQQEVLGKEFLAQQGSTPAPGSARYCVRSIAADPKRDCLWLTTATFVKQGKKEKPSGALWRFDVGARKLTRASLGRVNPFSCAWLPDGRLVIASANKKATMFDPETGALSPMFERARPGGYATVSDSIALGAYLRLHEGRAVLDSVLLDDVLVTNSNRTVRYDWIGAFSSNVKAARPLQYTPDGKRLQEINGIAAWRDEIIFAEKSGDIWRLRLIEPDRPAAERDGWRPVHSGYPLGKGLDFEVVLDADIYTKPQAKAAPRRPPAKAPAKPAAKPPVAKAPAKPAPKRRAKRRRAKPRPKPSPAQMRVALLASELRAYNGDKPVKMRPVFADGELAELHLVGNRQLSSVKPLAGIRLRSLTLSGCAALRDLGELADIQVGVLNLTRCSGFKGDLSPLQNIKLTKLNLRECIGITSLRGIEKMPLDELILHGCRGLKGDLPELKGMKLTRLDLTKCAGITTLRNIEGLPLTDLTLAFCKQLGKDFARLKGMKLARLSLRDCGLRRLDNLTGMPLTELDLRDSPGLTGDLSALKGMKLTRLTLHGCTGLTSLKGVEGMPLESALLTNCPGLTDKDYALLATIPTLKKLGANDKARALATLEACRKL